MAFKYSLYQKSKDPRNPDSEKQWYGAPQSNAPLESKAMTRAATKNTTIAPSELGNALDLLADFIPEQLLQGHTVTIPGLGYFRLTFKSKGAASVEDFDPREMFYDVRPVFVPDKAFRKRVQDNIIFEDGGVTKDGVSYRTRADYLQQTGGSSAVTPGGGGEEGEEGTYG